MRLNDIHHHCIAPVGGDVYEHGVKVSTDLQLFIDTHSFNPDLCGGASFLHLPPVPL